jgi:hypothetical protein
VHIKSVVLGGGAVADCMRAQVACVIEVVGALGLEWPAKVWLAIVIIMSVMQCHIHTLCAAAPVLCCCAAAGVIDCAKKTVQWEGLPGLYKVR